MNISRTLNGPVEIEFANGTSEYLTNPENVTVRGKKLPAKNADFLPVEEVRLFDQEGMMLYNFDLRYLKINGVAYVGSLKDAVQDVAELVNEPVA